MSLSKSSKVTAIEVSPLKVISYEISTTIEENGNSIGSGLTRSSIYPGQSPLPEGLPSEVANVANALWTQEVIAEYNAVEASQAPAEDPA